MIQDSVNRISYDGNGLATEFAYPFSITSTQDIKVMLVDTDGTETILTNDFYIDEANAKVNYPGYPPGEEPLPELQPPKLADGQRIVIYRELDVTQLTSLFDQYPFKTIEVMIDKTTILLQQLQDAQQRALTLSVSTGTDVSLILPAPSAHKSFRWNADGTSLELTEDPATVLASVQGYTSQAQGYATTANEKATLATNGANTATEQANLAQGYAESINVETFNAASADKLKTARTIAGTSFDGSANIDVSYENLTNKPTILATATEAQASAGTDDATIITPAKLRNGLNAGGSAPIFACRAWVNFNGTGTVRIRASGNVSSITDNGVGDYTLNFESALQDEKYGVTVSGGDSGTGTGQLVVWMTGEAAALKTTTALRVKYRGGGGYYDNAELCVQIFR